MAAEKHRRDDDYEVTLSVDKRAVELFGEKNRQGADLPAIE